ncbi:MAG: adenylyl-sulfate reductase subunit alpha [Deltaproteobacteria bacterium]|jgi:adenylylsulfate reductase subunit A|nr:adenylyl-sulfate reductase subunit alpha [Deltaproteobacteria bacterium]
MRLETVTTDILIIGGGAAGCYAAVHAARRSRARVLVVDKAAIERSGCLAPGVNAINAYIGEGRTPEDYVKYARHDAAGIAREDLLLSMAERLNAVTCDLEALGLVIQKDGAGRYAQRGWRNVKINGENIKPLLAKAVRSFPSIRVLERVNVVSYLTENGKIFGAIGFSLTEELIYVFHASAVLCATGGAAGLYLPNGGGSARHALWYSPFNTGAGYAMGILAGAEMTTLEMRFVALRCKGTIAPTGTLALGAGAKQVNALGEVYENRYGLTTPERALGTRMEQAEGRGPCALRVESIDSAAFDALRKAYLNMCPLQALSWSEKKFAAPSSLEHINFETLCSALNGESEFHPRLTGGRRGFALSAAGQFQSDIALEVEIECTEPYLVGGHTASGYWVDIKRRTTIGGLFAAGDAAGGCPQKYASGAMAEGAIAVEAALEDIQTAAAAHCPERLVCKSRDEMLRFLQPGKALFTVDELETAMQHTMDAYAGGMGAGYAFNMAGLGKAEVRISEIASMSEELRAGDMRELKRICELRERLVVCRALIAHLRAREETRWPGYGRNDDYPEKSAAWLRYVNSVLREGRVEIIFRDMAGEKERL